MMAIDRALLGYRRLACAILLRAWADCHSTNGAKWAKEAGIYPATLAGDARAFLESDGAAWLVAVLDDLDPRALDRLRATFPPAEWGQLPFDLEVRT